MHLSDIWPQHLMSFLFLQCIQNRRLKVHSLARNWHSVNCIYNTVNTLTGTVTVELLPNLSVVDCFLSKLNFNTYQSVTFLTGSYLWNSTQFGILELCWCLHQRCQLCLDHCADSWYIRTHVLCAHYYFIGGFIGILIMCLMKGFSNALNTYTDWKGSNTITVQLQLAVLSQSACCTILIPQLQAHDSKLQYSHNLVGFTTVTYPDCLLVM